MRTLTGIALIGALTYAACAHTVPAAGSASTPAARAQNIVTRASGSPSFQPRSTGADAGTFEAVIGDHFFDPAVIRIKVGTTVTWRLVNGHHDVTAHDGSFRSGPMDAGAFSHRFALPGSYRYFCSVHRGAMEAEVIVEPAN